MNKILDAIAAPILKTVNTGLRVALQKVKQWKN